MKANKVFIKKKKEQLKTEYENQKIFIIFVLKESGKI